MNWKNISFKAATENTKFPILWIKAKRLETSPHILSAVLAASQVYPACSVSGSLSFSLETAPNSDIAEEISCHQIDASAVHCNLKKKERNEMTSAQT